MTYTAWEAEINHSFPQCAHICALITNSGHAVGMWIVTEVMFVWEMIVHMKWLLVKKGTCFDIIFKPRYLKQRDYVPLLGSLTEIILDVLMSKHA